MTWLFDLVLFDCLNSRRCKDWETKTGLETFLNGTDPVLDFRVLTDLSHSQDCNNRVITDDNPTDAVSGFGGDTKCEAASFFFWSMNQNVFVQNSYNCFLVGKMKKIYTCKSLFVSWFTLDCKPKQNTRGHKTTTGAAAAASNLPTEALCSDFIRSAPFEFASRQRKDYGTSWKDDEKKKICPTLQTSP